jgi:surface protein
MFFNCSSFNDIISNWDVSNATNFVQMFGFCTVFNKSKLCEFVLYFYFQLFF